ncbi:reverse transcriptase family protein [Vibrio vulnificus]|nr:reverse transcriptase family protein [Vibrio vulnificus]MCU8506561.1 reverse transcriptase family protein [Vibrio vulnificus]
MNENQWEDNSNGVWSITLTPKLSKIYADVVWREWLSEPGMIEVLNVRKIHVDTGGKKRQIYSPDMNSKVFYQALLPNLNETFEKMEERAVAFGFVPKRSCVDQALQHRNYAYTISLDIKDFFDHVKPKHVKGLIDEELIPYLFIDGAARQGLPTSPMVSNIAFNAIDREIIAFLEDKITLISDKPKYSGSSWGWEEKKRYYTYTRYADDLSVSLDSYDDIARVINGVQRILLRHGFELNARKTKILDAKNGRRVICGVGVDVETVYPTRKTLKKLRAARHQKNLSSVFGHRAWIYSIDKKKPVR